MRPSFNLSPQSVIGRLAPSPTGALHLGNARSFVVVWLAARLAGGRLVCRIEDLDGPRVKPWATDQALADLDYLGLDFDGPVLRQTQHLERYAPVLRTLQNAGVTYPCICSRKDVLAAVSAPHAGDLGPPYPGTCRDRFRDYTAAQAQLPDRPAALRLRLPPGLPPVEFVDGFAGPQKVDLPGTCGDFVIAKAPQVPAYQLAVVIDDADQGVNQVIRADDLLTSTALQIHLQKLLNLPTPAYLHLPLVVGADGRRLAKRHGDTRLSWFREQGVTGAQIVGFLAFRSGLIDRDEAITAAELLQDCRAKIGAGSESLATTGPAAAALATTTVSGWLANTIPELPLVLSPETIARALLRHR